MKCRIGGLAIGLLFFAMVPAHARESRAAVDYVFLNGKVYTLNPKAPWAQAVAVRKDKIVSVGQDRDIRKLAGPGTQVIDLKGRMLMPGFIDAHNHFIAGAIPKRGVKLNGSKDTAELLSRIRKYVTANPDRPLYMGYGWSYTIMGEHKSNRHELDAISRDKPIVLFNDDAHSIW